MVLKVVAASVRMTMPIHPTRPNRFRHGKTKLVVEEVAVAVAPPAQGLPA